MSDRMEKMIAESDPEKLAERSQDEKGSFLDLYRSFSAEHIPMDEWFVRSSVDQGIIPEAVRYGIMRRGAMEVFRGVVKSTNGELFYFNYSEGKPFILANTHDSAQVQEASRMFKSFKIGCDLRKSDAPLDPGESLEEQTDPEDEGAEKAVGQGGSHAGAAQAPISEDQYMAQQDSLSTQHHPGSTQSGMPDDPNVGRNWHEPLRRAQDGLNELGVNDGKQHWNTAGLLKALGQHLQETAPRVGPKMDAMEQRYMQEVGGDVRKGMTPRQRVGFEQWKAAQLRGRLNPLQSWLRKQS